MAGIERLYELRNRFEPAAAAEKLELLTSLGPRQTRSAAELTQLHTALCFLCAFPDSVAHRELAQRALESFEERVAACPDALEHRLWDTGIAGTPVHYGFSFEVASWLARRTRNAVSIDWEDTHDPPGLDEILTHLLEPGEDEYFDSGYVSAREWIEQASHAAPGTDFEWLLAQLGSRRFASIWSQLYDATDLWLTWDLSGSRFSKSRNMLPIARIRTRENGMRRPKGPVKRQIMEPLTAITRLSPREGAMFVDCAMASLAVRHRETYHFNHANAAEVYVADVGEGVAVAVFGLKPADRFPLECTMGYLILANGVPVGYGGSSIVFRQINTGINIFDEYRGSEAAFLWVQVMRVYHALTGCTRFIANPYQFGAENIEALKSGAFWFYYRLGYRPVELEVRMLAREEAHRLRHDRGYRSDTRTLRRLASCDMHLTLPGARASELFHEDWLTTSSMLATQVLGRAGGRTRRESVQRVAAQVARQFDVRDLDRWSADERRGFERIAPIVAAAESRDWSRDSKRAMRQLLRAKGGAAEARYARLLGEHTDFLEALRRACRRADALLF